MHITVTPPAIATHAAARPGAAEFPAIFGGVDASPASPQDNPTLDDSGLPDESEMDDEMQDDDDPDEEEQEDFEPGDEIAPKAPDEIPDTSEPEIDLPLHDLQEH